MIERLTNPIEEIFYNKTTKYTSKWSQYFDIYHTWFQKFINQKPTVLEIGVDNGGSLQMWYEYFGPGCDLIGIDNRPKFDFQNPDEYLGFAAELIVGDQGDASFWDNYTSSAPRLNCVIDDGSHFQEHQLLTLEKLWPIMNEGGIYMVEDTHASYMKIFGGSYKGERTFIQAMKDVIDGLHIDYLEEIDGSIKSQLMSEPYSSIKSIHFFDSVVVLEKGLRPKYNTVYANRSIAI